MMISRLVAMAILMIGLFPIDATRGQGVLANAAYLNTAFCFGAVESYGEILLGTNESTFRSAARKAKRIAEMLRDKSERLRLRYKFDKPQGESASANGTRTMTGLLPASGVWTQNGEIPNQAFRQYQNCLSLVQ